MISRKITRKPIVKSESMYNNHNSKKRLKKQNYFKKANEIRKKIAAFELVMGA